MSTEHKRMSGDEEPEKDKEAGYHEERLVPDAA